MRKIDESQEGQEASEDQQLSKMIITWIFIPAMVILMLLVFFVLGSDSDQKSSTAVSAARYTGMPPAGSQNRNVSQVNPQASNMKYSPMPKELGSVISTDEFEVSMYLDLLQSNLGGLKDSEFPQTEEEWEKLLDFVAAPMKAPAPPTTPKTSATAPQGVKK